MGTSTADPCVPLPHEQSGSSGESSVGIWAHMVNITGLWSEVRCYISECAEGRTKLPWMPESRYSSINSQILEFERTFPDVHRYESANFSGQLVAKVFAEREYWLPWMRVQISYHCVSCILNHPFLLSSAKPKSITGTNAFWKSSSQLALLHGTWISRILQLAKNKNLELNDPYFTYAAVVAATLHTYWSRATDEAVQASARKHLDTCQTFVADWGPRWPVSEFLVPLLNKFVNLMLNQDFVQHDRREVARAKVSLVWSLFDFALYRPDPRNRGLFSPAFAEHQALQLAVQQANFTVDDPDVETRPDHVYRMVDGCAVSAAYQNRPYSAESPRGSLQPQQDAESSNDGIAGVTSQFDWEWASGLAQYYHDPSARPHEQSDVNLDWWEVGNL